MKKHKDKLKLLKEKLNSNTLSLDLDIKEIVKLLFNADINFKIISLSEVTLFMRLSRERVSERKVPMKRNTKSIAECLEKWPKRKIKENRQRSRKKLKCETVKNQTIMIFISYQFITSMAELSSNEDWVSFQRVKQVTEMILSGVVLLV